MQEYSLFTKFKELFVISKPLQASDVHIQLNNGK
jgi:hypothetical protein